MITLLPHNIPTYHSVEEKMEQYKKVMLTQATGTGKTYVAGKFIEEHSERPLILVPTVAIGNQWEKLGLGAEIATYQSMHKIDFSKYDLFVPDESHHLGSEVWGKKFIECVINNPNTRVLGLTATDIRYLDNSRDMTEELFRGIAVRGVDLAEAINQGILPTFKYVSAYYGTEEDYNEYREKCGRIADKERSEELSRRLELCIQNQISIKEAMHENLNMKDHKIIVFLNGICEIEQAVEMFRDIFPNCECNYVSSKESSKANDEAITKYQTSDAHISILFAIDMLNEGVHIDETDCVVMFRNTESPQIYFQQMGRCLDSNEGPDRVVFDFVCNADSIKANIGNSEKTNIIHIINKKIRDKKRKIIIKSYTKELEDVIQQIQGFIGRSSMTEEQEKFLVQNADRYTAPEISKMTGVKVVTIRAYCKRKGINLKKATTYLTDSQKNFLLENREKTYTELANEIGCGVSTVSAFLKKHGDGKRWNSVVWSEDEKMVLYKNKNSTYTELSELLPERSVIAISEMMKKLGLREPKKGLKEIGVLELHSKGECIKSIADEMQTTTIYVRKVLIKHGKIAKQSKCGAKRISQIDNATGKIVAVFESASEAARINSYRSPSKLNNAALNDTMAYGYKWKYED